MTKIYKVVRQVKQFPGVQGKQRISAMTPQPGFAVVYSSNQWVQAKLGLLFVFLDEDLAWAFHNVNEHYLHPLEVWLAETPDIPVETHTRAHAWWDILAFWGTEGPVAQGIAHERAVPTPKGTYGVSKLKIYTRLLRPRDPGL